MCKARMTENDYLERAVSYALEHESSHPIRINDRYYVKSDELLMPLESASYYHRHSDFALFYVMSLYWAFRNAELLRWSVVDESIPYRAKHCSFEIYDGGRKMNALALGELQYTAALPELREAMLHDRNNEFKYYCVQSIGSMGPKARYLGKDIRKAILQFDDAFFRCEAVDTLVKIDDKESVPLLREFYDETRYQIHSMSESDRLKDTHVLLLLEAIVKALLVFDSEAGREALAKGLLDENDHVYHFTKRATFWSSARDQVKLMKKNNAIAVAFLPKDPTWSFDIRQR